MAMATRAEGTRPRRPFGRNSEDFPDITPAELKLRDAAYSGEHVELADAVPDEKDSENEVRGEYLRFLALGGDDKTPVHESGISLAGAFVTGSLSLLGAEAKSHLALRHCRFEKGIMLRDAHISGLDLEGSHVDRIDADRLRCEGSLFFSGGFDCGFVGLGGALISGDVSFGGASIKSSENVSISADGLSADGDLFLCDGFKAEGEVRFVGARVGGDVTCHKCEFFGEPGLTLDRVKVDGAVHLGPDFVASGDVRLIGASVAGVLNCTNSRFNSTHGLNAERAEIGTVLLKDSFTPNGPVNFFSSTVRAGVFIVRNDIRSLVLAGAEVRGVVKVHRLKASRIDFSHMTAGTLSDDWSSYDSVAELLLDGLTYDRLTNGFTDAETRIKWLQKQSSTGEFHSQPWEHLASVLRQMGHFEDAKVIGVAKQEFIRRLGLIGVRRTRAELRGIPAILGRITVGLWNRMTRFLHWLYGALAGYGFRPIKTVAWMLLSWAAGAVFYYLAAHDGMIGPTNVRIYTAAEYEACGTGADHDAELWTSCSKLPPEYVQFNPIIYSLDLALPVVDLQQEQNWTPLTMGESGRSLRGGSLLRLLMWAQIVFGWLTSLLLVSALGRLIQKD